VQHHASTHKMSRSEAARKGGQAVSANRQHMAEIGRKGGQAVSRDREHMARIGRTAAVLAIGYQLPAVSTDGRSPADS
jgi:general stress protein YciG